MTKKEVYEYAAGRKEILRNLKQMIVEQLSLDLEAEFITDDQPLFGRGLELDSIDALELSIGLYNEYNITLSDGENDIFSSVNTMVDYILENSNKTGDDGMSLDGDVEIMMG